MHFDVLLLRAFIVIAVGAALLVWGIDAERFRPRIAIFGAILIVAGASCIVIPALKGLS